MSQKKERHSSPSRFVTHAECTSIMDSVKAELKTIKVTLIGEDMRGGLVKDVQEIKSATSIVKTVIVPMVISVSAALITYTILHAF